MTTLTCSEQPAVGNVFADVRDLDHTEVRALLQGLLGADAAGRLSDNALDGILRALRLELGGEYAQERELTDVMSGVIDKLGLSGTLREAHADQVNALLDIVDGVRVNGVAATVGKIKQAAHEGKIRGLFEKPIINDRAKVGRNDKCSCGSGRKYKHCCMSKK